VNLRHALDTAKNCARLAEETDDQQSREYYLNLARQWLARVDLEARFERIAFPAVNTAFHEGAAGVQANNNVRLSDRRNRTVRSLLRRLGLKPMNAVVLGLPNSGNGGL
jgi:hypothetical protein